MKIVSSQYEHPKNQQRNVIRVNAGSRKTHGRLSYVALSTTRGHSGFENGCKTRRRQVGQCGSTVTPRGELRRRNTHELEFAFGGRHSRHERGHISGSGLFYQLHRLTGFRSVRKTFVALFPLLFCFALTACENAVATDEATPTIIAKPLTRAECLAMEVKEDKIACLKKLTTQRKIELAQKKIRLDETKRKNEQLQKENEALLKEFERGVLGEE